MFRTITCLLAAFAVVSLSHAQEKSGGRKMSVRFLAHDPVKPLPEAYAPAAEGGERLKLELVIGNLTQAREIKATGDSLVLYKSVDGDPSTDVLAKASLGGSMTKVIAILVATSDAKQPYRMFLINDSSSGFAGGESRVLNMVPVEIAVQAGEHRMLVKPGSIASIPPVKKKNESNIAQTDFYYKKGADSWQVFTERQVQYLDVFRRIYLIYSTPGATQPFVTTVVDTAQPPKAAGNS